MGLLRLLFFIALIYAAFWLWRRYISGPKRTKQAPPQAHEQSAPMVRCEQCGVHVPQSKAITHNQHWYCCQKHLEQGRPNSER